MQNTFLYQLVTPSKKISLKELEVMSTRMSEAMVKAVIDIEKEIMVVDAAMHVDEETILLDQESKQKNLWGINFHPKKFETEGFIEFDSMINYRPASENFSRGVQNPLIQQKIRSIVQKLVTL